MKLTIKQENIQKQSGKLLGKPVEAFVEPVSSSSAASLNKPFLASERGKAEFFSDLRNRHASTDILLVCKNEDGLCAVEVFVCNEFVEFLFGNINALFVVRVNDKDDAIAVGEVVLPEDSDFVLTAQVPDLEVEVLEANFLTVEADSRNSGDCLTKFELVEDCGLASCVQADKHNSDVFLEFKESLPCRRED